MRNLRFTELALLDWKRRPVFAGNLQWRFKNRRLHILKKTTFAALIFNMSTKTKRPSFDEIYMELAENLGLRSHCVKAKVGAVLTKDTRIISLGYNGTPAGTHNCDIEWPEVGCPRDSKGSCSLALHAEMNAILYASKNNVPIEG